MGKGSNRLVYLVAPVKNAAGENVHLVIGGVTEDPTDAPGPFGVYVLITTPSDRVREFSFTASGGSYAKLFDGPEKLLSWDNILWNNRSVLLPSVSTALADPGEGALDIRELVGYATAPSFSLVIDKGWALLGLT